MRSLGSRLFEPIEIGGLQIKNRFVRSATHEWLAGDDGSLNERIFEIYTRLAKGGLGLIISGYSYVSPCGKGSERQQGIYDDSLIDGYRLMATKVHEHDSKLFIQIVHCGRSSLVSKNCPHPLSPTSLPIPGSKSVSKEMTKGEILKTIDDFISAAERSRKSGADGVQLHCAHGFLFSEFLSPFLNRREDDWGGDTERRTRIVVETIRGVRKKCSGYPLAVKMNVVDGVKGGVDRAEAVSIAKIFEEEGVDAIETSGGIDEADADLTCQNIRCPSDEGYFKEYAKEIKKNVDCPVILVGGLRSLETMERMLSEGYADMISMSRPLIREPNFVRNLFTGDSNSAKCTSCNKCFDTTGIKCNVRQTERD